MVFDLSKDIQFHEWHNSFLSYGHKQQNQTQSSRAVSLVTADGHFNLIGICLGMYG